MIRKIWEIVSVIAVANFLAMLMLLALLAATGGLQGDRLKQAADALAGRPPRVVTVVEPAKENDLASLVTSGQRIAQNQTNTQSVQLQADQQLRELKDFQVRLDQDRAALDQRIAQLEQDKRDWQARRDQDLALKASDGFRKSVTLYESMSPDQVKDLMMTMEETDAVRLIAALDERKVAKLVKAFTGEAEKAKLRRIMDRMERPADKPLSAAGVPSAAAATGAAGAGKAAPAAPAGPAAPAAGTPAPAPSAGSVSSTTPARTGS